MMSGNTIFHSCWDGHWAECVSADNKFKFTGKAEDVRNYINNKPDNLFICTIWIGKDYINLPDIRGKYVTE